MNKLQESTMLGLVIKYANKYLENIVRVYQTPICNILRSWGIKIIDTPQQRKKYILRYFDEVCQSCDCRDRTTYCPCIHRRQFTKLLGE
jgi:predicted metal-dependent hydrolase